MSKKLCLKSKMNSILILFCLFPLAFSLNQTSCGKRFAQILKTRIVGGRKALEGEFPWTVSLATKINGSKELIKNCGGSIVTERTIITAAHCFLFTRSVSIQFTMNQFQFNLL